MEANQNVSETRRTNYLITLDGIGLGLTDDVDPSGVKIMTEPIQCGSTGKIILGERVIGIEGSIKIQHRQVNRTMIDRLMPMIPTTGGSRGGPLNLNIDLYDHAKRLTLHPIDKATGDTSEDVHFLKAVPIVAVAPKRTGKEDDVMDVEYKIYPDRSTMTSAPYKPTWFWIGPIPA